MSLTGCALTTCTKYRTPLGDLDIDLEGSFSRISLCSSPFLVNAHLAKTEYFDTMDRQDEESEHSIEMQLPFLAKIFEGLVVAQLIHQLVIYFSRNITIVPVLVGSLSGNRQQLYGKVFARYIEDSKNLFVISSDFCHWGGRFHYTPYNTSSREPIYEQITKLDREVCLFFYLKKSAVDICTCFMAQV